MNQDLELRTAEYFAGDLDPAAAEALRQEILAQPGGSGAWEQMESTIQALRGWRDTVQPRPVLQRPPSRLGRVWSRIAPIAAAAAIIFALILPWTTTGPTEPEPSQLTGGLVISFEEQARSLLALRDQPADSVFRFVSTSKLGGDGGGPPGRGSGQPGTGDPVLEGGNPTVPPPAAAPLQSKLDEFRQQFDFGFFIPASLGDFNVDHGTRLSPTALTITYQDGHVDRSVLLCDSPGPDQPLTKIIDKDKPMLTIRKDGILLAMEDEPEVAENLPAWIDWFLPRK